jgi:ribosomal 50S subunit-associated protein YjgA (DUF615 family)
MISEWERKKEIVMESRKHFEESKTSNQQMESKYDVLKAESGKQMQDIKPLSEHIERVKISLSSLYKEHHRVYDAIKKNNDLEDVENKSKQFKGYIDDFLLKNSQDINRIDEAIKLLEPQHSQGIVLNRLKSGIDELKGWPASIQQKLDLWISYDRNLALIRNLIDPPSTYSMSRNRDFLLGSISTDLDSVKRLL